MTKGRETPMKSHALSRLVSLFLLTSIVAASCGCASAQKKRAQEREARLMRRFGDAQGCFVLLDVAHGQTLRLNAPRCAERFSPCSTFKIPNSLIGLETGVIEDADFVIPWDKVVRDREAWNKSHTLRTAMENSVVWYYQELARRAGPERMRKYIDMIPYGDGDLSGGLTQFWLGSTLKISADEQVEFLRRLTRDQLPFSKRSMAIVRDIMPMRRWPDGTLMRGKTGSNRGEEPGHDLGWYVGWVQRGGGLYIFAANMEGKGTFGPEARETVVHLLQELKVLPEDS